MDALVGGNEWWYDKIVSEGLMAPSFVQNVHFSNCISKCASRFDVANSGQQAIASFSMTPDSLGQAT